MSKNYLDRILATLLLLGFFLAPAMAEKTDVVVLVNGNAVTGEVKSLEFGILSYSTDSMGTVSIDWEDIVSVSSQRFQQVELPDGTRYYGQLVPTSDPHVVRIVTAIDEYVVESSQIVRITPIESNASFVERLEGSFSFGIQTQKASGITTSNLAGDVSYRERKYLVGLRISSAITDQDAEPTSARQSISINYQRFRGNRWFTDWFTGAERNDELGIALRTSASGALGRYAIQTNKNQLSLSAGIQGAWTDFTGESERSEDAEGKVEIRYQHRNKQKHEQRQNRRTFVKQATLAGGNNVQCDTDDSQDHAKLEVTSTALETPGPDNHQDREEDPSYEVRVQMSEVLRKWDTEKQ